MVPLGRVPISEGLIRISQRVKWPRDILDEEIPSSLLARRCRSAYLKTTKEVCGVEQKTSGADLIRVGSRDSHLIEAEEPNVCDVIVVQESDPSAAIDVDETSRLVDIEQGLLIELGGRGAELFQLQGLFSRVSSALSLDLQEYIVEVL